MALACSAAAVLSDGTTRKPHSKVAAVARRAFGPPWDAALASLGDASAPAEEEPTQPECASEAWWWKGGAGDESEEEMHLYVPIPEDVGPKDVVVEIRRKHLTIGIRGQPPVINGELWKEIKCGDSGWVIDVEKGQRCIICTLIKRDVWIDYDHLLKQEDVVVDTRITSRCFLDISINGKPKGRVVVGLYGSLAPRAVENFRALCVGTGYRWAKSGEPLHFKGTPFHRIVPQVLLQGGDVTHGDGRGGMSIYGRTFEDESFAVGHSRAGLLSAANAGPDTNASQFFITMYELPHLDGKHVVFGEVLDGFQTLKRMEACGDLSGTPSLPVLIEDCGELLA